MFVEADSSPAVTIVVPVYNEASTIRDVMIGISRLPLDNYEVIVVDDGSTDETRQVLDRFFAWDARIRLIHLASNLGKTAAVERGIKESRGQIVVIQDADLEYDPQDIPQLIAPIAMDEADVVYGSRILNRRSRGDWSFIRYWANRAITRFNNIFVDWEVTDVETGYKAFRAPLVREICLTSRRFGIEIEITAIVCRTAARFKEIPVRYSPRSVADGKKIRFRDGLWALYYILRCNLTAARDRRTIHYVQAANKFLCDFRQSNSK